MVDGVVTGVDEEVEVLTNVPRPLYIKCQEATWET